MWYHPAAFFVGNRDVVGAWVICLAVATAFFGYPIVMTALDVGAEDFHTAAAGLVLGADQRTAGQLCRDGLE